MTNPMPDLSLLHTLNAQIEDICKSFQTIRGEALEIASNNKMPDATLHLNDVLQHTEEATHTILDAATAINALAQSSAATAVEKQKITDLIGLIYEACSFQDISGQRIKKVLGHMNALEAQLLRLSDTAHGKALPPKNDDPLLNGPQLAAEAPSQADIDQMFSKSK